VNQTQTSIRLAPLSVTLPNSTTQQLAASALDQFANSMATQPSLTWSIDSGGIGSVNSSGLYSSPASGTGSAIVRATAGSMSGTASVTVSTIPAAPSNLSATAVSGSTVNLSWTDNSSNETGFTIQRSTNGGTSWTQIATVGAGVTSYSDATVSKRKTYEYRVAAYNGAGTSAWSNVASVTTPNRAPQRLVVVYPAPDVPDHGDKKDGAKEKAHGSKKRVEHDAPHTRHLPRRLPNHQSGDKRKSHL
jgi:hypothetical protein